MKLFRRGFRVVAIAIPLAVVMPSMSSAKELAEPDVPSTSTIHKKAAWEELESYDRWRNSVMDERQILERQAERQFVSIEKLIDRALWVFGILGTALLGLFVWLFGQSRQDFKKSIAEKFEQQAQDIVEKEAAQLRQRYESLKEEVEDLSSYKRRQVTWVAKPDANNHAMVQKALFSSGIQNVFLVTPETDQEFEIGDPDLVVLTFDGSDEGKRLLSILVQRLKQQSPPVPLLIYTFLSGETPVRLAEAEHQILDGFDWYVPVNYPAQLLAQIQLLIRRNRNILGGDRGDM